MEFLGVGPVELIFILVIILIVIGPRDLAKTGTTIGRFLNNLIQSDTWRAVQRTSKELRQLPTNLMREANLEKMLAEKNINPASVSNAGTWQGRVQPIPKAENQVPHAEGNQQNVIKPPVIIPTPEAVPTQAVQPKKPTQKKTASPAKKPARKTTKSAPRKKSNA